LLLARSRTNFKTIATAADESIGRALDKGARALGLAPTGAALEQFCQTADGEGEVVSTHAPRDAFVLPMPRQLGFSYSGLRSQLERHVQSIDAKFGTPSAVWSGVPHLPGDTLPVETAQIENVSDAHRETLRSLGRMYQRAAFGHLGEKVGLALRWCREQLEPEGKRVQAVVVSGGVASNLLLRDMCVYNLTRIIVLTIVIQVESGDRQAGTWAATAVSTSCIVY